jgi:uncharacterized protein (TIGR02147 family)
VIHPRPSNDPDYRQLAHDTFEVVSAWYHFAILELIRVDGFEPKPKWIAVRLGISAVEATAAVERLVRVGLLAVSPEGRWPEANDERLTVITPGESARAQRLLQRQILEKAIEALERVPISRRDQTTITMAIDVARLAEAKERIKKFRRSLAKFLSRAPMRQEVYNLSVSLYPVTGMNPKENPT